MKATRATRPAIGQATVVAAVGASLLLASNIAAQVKTGATAEMERVIVTGSNIPSAEEVGRIPLIRIAR